jgi:prepilin-type N-terminal cleavage/methylation domain-containing protein/prepilin-type processing-associated H-X9-DG protein
VLCDSEELMRTVRAGVNRMGRERTRDRYRRPGGFTLIELLVVISIICLMMSLMLPSLTRAQKQGEQIHCLANQHQLYLAWLLYLHDSDDRLCLPTHFESDLAHYTQLPEVFWCKSVQGERGHNSYAISNIMGGAERDGVRPYERFHPISHVAEKMVFVDKEDGGAECFWPLVWNRTTWVWRPWSWPPGLQGMTARHSNGCNMTFADGHGEATHWKDERTLKLIRGTLADEKQASAQNPDLAYVVRVLGANRAAAADGDEPPASSGETGRP